MNYWFRDVYRHRVSAICCLLHDAGAYGYAMSSNYNSLGRAPQLMLEEDGSATQFSRRETVDDLLRIETNEKIS